MEDDIERLRRLGGTSIQTITPFITPKIKGCTTLNSLGYMCLGSDEIDKSTWCDNCLCYYKEEK